MEQETEEKYDGWLISNSFIKRALAVAGYSTIGTIIIYLIFLLIIVILTVPFAFLGY